MSSNTLPDLGNTKQQLQQTHSKLGVILDMKFSQMEIIEAMSRPDFYPRQTQRVEIVQTHISYVFICDDEVYKIKKPVDFGFLDFTSLEKRRYYCEQEILLNRRLAASFYLGVVPIRTTASRQGFTLATGEEGDGEIVEYAVKMKRIPTEKMLKNLLASSLASPETMKRIAQRLVEFHNSAKSNEKISEFGKIDTIRLNNEENFSQTERFIGLTIPAPQHRFLQFYSRTFLAKHQKLLEERVLKNKIRDCHGDLHLEHIICTDEEVIIFDCIEFNERFRYGDIAAEVAFLAMDLDFENYSEISQSFVLAYIAYSQDSEIAALLDFYKCYYAFVRGKVTSFRWDEDNDIARRAIIAQSAKKYFDLAEKYACIFKKPMLFIICGLMGTGKTFLRKGLATKLGVEALEMDALRKEMLAIPLQKHCYDDFEKGIYSQEITQRVYEKALALAQKNLSQGKSIIIDASFKNREHRAAAQKIAQQAGADFIAIQCTCPAALVKERLQIRASRENSSSDGRWEIYAQQEQNTDAYCELSEKEFFQLDTSLDKEESLYEALIQITKRLA